MSTGAKVVLRCMYSFKSHIPEYELELASSHVIHFVVNWTARTVEVKVDSHSLPGSDVIGRLDVLSGPSCLIFESLTRGTELERDSVCRGIGKNLKETLMHDDIIAFCDYHLKILVTVTGSKFSLEMHSPSGHDPFLSDPEPNTSSEAGPNADVETEDEAGSATVDLAKPHLDQEMHEPQDSEDYHASMETQAIGDVLFKSFDTQRNDPRTSVETETETEAIEEEATLSQRRQTNWKLPEVPAQFAAQPTIPDSDAPEAPVDLFGARQSTSAMHATEPYSNEMSSSEDYPSADNITVLMQSPGEKLRIPAKSKAVTPTEARPTYDIEESEEERPSKRTRTATKRSSASQKHHGETRPESQSDDELVRATQKPQRFNKSRENLAPPVAMPTACQYTSLLGDAKLKVLISRCTLDSDSKTWLGRKAQRIYAIPNKTIKWICVVPKKGVPTSTKVLRSIMAKKLIVSEVWIDESKAADRLLDPLEYIHPDVEGTLGDDRRKKLFSGMTLFFLTSAKKTYGDEWTEIEAIVKEAGCMRVECGSATKGNNITPKHQVVFLADSAGHDASELNTTYGRNVYDRKLITRSILRGSLDLNADEFRLSATEVKPSKSKKDKKK